MQWRKFDEQYQRIAQAVHANAKAHKAHEETLQNAAKKRDADLSRAVQTRDATLQQLMEEQHRRLADVHQAWEVAIQQATERREAAKEAATKAQHALLSEIEQVWGKVAEVSEKDSSELRVLGIPEPAAPRLPTSRDAWWEAYQQVRMAHAQFSAAVQALRAARRRTARIRRILLWEIVIMLFLLMVTLIAQSERREQYTYATAIVAATSNDTWMPIATRIGDVEMVRVPAGCFEMGSTEEQFRAAVAQCVVESFDQNACEQWFAEEMPVHQQCFSEPYWIGRYEVTNAQYQQCVDAGVCDSPKSDYDAVFYADDHPVIGVSWFDAQQYVQWLSVTTGAACRLPTEAEWEYAARGPAGLIYPWGNEFIADNVVYRNNSDNHTQAVGSKPGGASWVGALDMSGNVWEWMSTIYRGYPYMADDGREDINDTNNGRVVRGGSWYGLNSYCRVAIRGWYLPFNRDFNLGFRVVCTTLP